jgi:hypothetical protein
METSSPKELLISKAWIQAVALVMLFGFFVMGSLAYYTYTQQPPIPARVLESRLDSWLQSELSRFHRAISLALWLLALLVLIVEMARYREMHDWVALLVLLLPISFTGSRYLASFLERNAKENARSKTTFNV